MNKKCRLLADDKDLSPERKRILIDGGTEAPFSGGLLHEKASGDYLCGACGSKLFDSGARFDSGSGWPSFDQAIPGSINETVDNSHGMQRTEASCANCGGHLGHVFDDGPKETTGQRYCINSLSLDFRQKPETD